MHTSEGLCVWLFNIVEQCSTYALQTSSVDCPGK
jgi:hypothetical protein